MSFEDGEIKQNEFSQNKSKSNGLIIGLIVAVGVAAFFAGMYFSNMNSNQISQEDLDDAIAKLELKMLQNRLPTNQPSEPVKISADDDPVIGNPDAPITIIEGGSKPCCLTACAASANVVVTTH